MIPTLVKVDRHVFICCYFTCTTIPHAVVEVIPVGKEIEVGVWFLTNLLWGWRGVIIQRGHLIWVLSWNKEQGIVRINVRQVAGGGA